MKNFSWKDFDESVNYIANKTKTLNLSGIYGIPRGGLCLAVALSHKLNLNIFEKPLKYSLIVDDIFESGTTLEKYKNIEGAHFFVLFSKKEPIWWNTVNIADNHEWILFPWENKKNVVNDQKNYQLKRGLI